MSKWQDYQLIIDKNVLEKVNQYKPINNYGNSKNNRGFRISKNGKNTGLFTKIDMQNDNEYNNNIINSNNIENNSDKNEILQFENNGPKMFDKSLNYTIKLNSHNKIDLDEDDK